VLLGPREHDLGLTHLTPEDGVTLIETFDQVELYQVSVP
jgi:hypothetical protein